MSQTADKRPNALAAAAIEKDVRMALDLFEGFVTPDRMQLPEQQFLKGGIHSAPRQRRRGSKAFQDWCRGFAPVGRDPEAAGQDSNRTHLDQIQTVRGPSEERLGTLK
jgi:hypothetical protein